MLHPDPDPDCDSNLEFSRFPPPNLKTPFSLFSLFTVNPLLTPFGQISSFNLIYLIFSLVYSFNLTYYINYSKYKTYIRRSIICSTNYFGYQKVKTARRISTLKHGFVTTNTSYPTFSSLLIPYDSKLCIKQQMNDF